MNLYVILPIIIGSHIFTESSTFYAQKEIQEHLVFTLSMYLSVCKGSYLVSYITCITYVKFKMTICVIDLIALWPCCAYKSCYCILCACIR